MFVRCPDPVAMGAWPPVTDPTMDQVSSLAGRSEIKVIVNVSLTRVSPGQAVGATVQLTAGGTMPVVMVIVSPVA